MRSYENAARRSRLRVRIFLAALAAGIALIPVMIFFTDRVAAMLGSVSIALLVMAVVLFFTQRRLLCPHCQRATETFDKFCPSCGAQGLRRYTSAAARCGVCTRMLGNYKWRNYAIRFCTHCGVQLVEQRD